MLKKLTEGAQLNAVGNDSVDIAMAIEQSTFFISDCMDLDRSLWLIVGFNGGFKKFQGQEKLHHLWKLATHKRSIGREW